MLSRQKALWAVLCVLESCQCVQNFVWKELVHGFFFVKPKNWILMTGRLAPLIG